ncbi:MAG: site-specific integrase [Sulfuricurvum sp.]|uniref:site-specific integrase n=1 Tax=Sulfuricurvum sp. TaxID=2025608 RepID=UPI002600B75C|nr:site-specific integrase [Sulfuricurvum sp.]MCK9373630.1 site-specific integrase [Sulfuricurvum sp.]
MKYRYCRERDGIVHLDIPLSGKRIRRSTGRPATAANMKYVEKNWQAELEKLISDKTSDPQPDITVEAYGRRSLEANKGFRKIHTTREYSNTFEKHVVPVFGSLQLDAIVPSDLKAWLSKLQASGLSGKRIHNIRIVFQGILRDAVSDGIIPKNPFIGIKGFSRKAQHDIHPFTLPEIQYILQNAEGKLKAFLTVAFFTGMRTGELVALKWSDINLKSSKITVQRSIRGSIETGTKTGVVRTIDMLPPVADALKEQFKLTGLAGGYVFLNRYGKHYAGSTTLANEHWAPLLKRLMLDHRTLYQTRHSFATMMISKGEDVIWVSKMMEHANPSITLSIYSKYREEPVVKRAAFLDEINLFGEKNGHGNCHVSVT